MAIREIPETPYYLSDDLDRELSELTTRVESLRQAGSLSPNVLHRLRQFFRIKSIYHSNAIEGNRLDLGETRLVVEQGLTITGKPLKDTIEAKNLAHALDLFEQIASDNSRPVSESDIRAIHGAILTKIDDENAGRYRSSDVEISGSKYRPPNHSEVQSKTGELGEWLSKSSIPSAATSEAPAPIVAAIAHAWLAMIHPFVDGNGRTSRLLMNLILMRYGYPIAIITKDDRIRYYDALEESQSGDLTPLVGLIAECIQESLEEYEAAATEQKKQEEWAQSIAASFGFKEERKVRGEYEVWINAVELLKSYFNQTLEMVNDASGGMVRGYFKDFGKLEFEKYVALRRGNSVKRTWSFRLDFRSGERASRHLFFFGFPSRAMGRELSAPNVSLFTSFEDKPFSFQRTDEAQRQDIPDLAEIAFDLAKQEFVCRYRSGVLQRAQVEQFGRRFIDEIAKRRF